MEISFHSTVHLRLCFASIFSPLLQWGKPNHCEHSHTQGTRQPLAFYEPRHALYAVKPHLYQHSRSVQLFAQTQCDRPRSDSERSMAPILERLTHTLNFMHVGRCLESHRITHVYQVKHVHTTVQHWGTELQIFLSFPNSIMAKSYRTLIKQLNFFPSE